jgi:hypothetical protein
MLLECLAITLVFALTCGAVLIFMSPRRSECRSPHRARSTPEPQGIERPSE